MNGRTKAKFHHLDRSAVERPWYAQRFRTQAQFWAWVESNADAMIASGELNADKREAYLENMKSMQGERAKLIGEVGTLVKATLVNRSTERPKWECQCLDPFGEKIKVIAWPEDIVCVARDANADPWAYGNEVKGIEIGDSPDGLGRQFIIAMNEKLEFRMEPLQ